MATETILLDVQIDQSDAQKQLVQTEKNILNLKKQQAELNKEYKAGKISQDDYVEANLRLQKAINKENEQKRTLTKLVDTESNSRNALKLRVSELTKEYDNLNKSTAAGAARAQQLEKELKELNEEITKSSRSAGLFKDQIGNYPNQFQKIGSSIASASNEVKPFGISVDGATSSIARFATPATAALGILAGLGAAYAKSSSGAKDLAFAQDRLGFITSSLVEKFGTLVSGGGEGGQGILNKLLDISPKLLSVIPGLGIVLGNLFEGVLRDSKVAAQAAEDLRKLEIQAIRAQGFAKLFEKTAEEARRLRDDDEQDLQARLNATNAIEQNLQANQKVRINTLQLEIEALKKANVNWQNNDDVVKQIESRQQNILDIQEEITGKLTENVTARRAILDLIKQERNLTAADNRAQRRALDTTSFREFNPDFIADVGQQEIDANKAINESLLKANEDFYKRDIEAKKKAAALKEQIDTSQLYASATIAGAAASIFDQQSEEYKAFASAQTVISTYAAATKAYEAAFVPPTIASPALGAAYAAAAIAQGLANLAAINGVQFAEGGFTPPGSKYQPVGIVHAGEYVAPQSVVNSPAAQPHISALEGMRTGKRSFADGGFVSGQMISPYQMAMITANAIRNMPAPVVSVREFNRVADRVSIRENISKI